MFGDFKLGSFLSGYEEKRDQRIAEENRLAAIEAKNAAELAKERRDLQTFMIKEDYKSQRKKEDLRNELKIRQPFDIEAEDRALQNTRTLENEKRVFQRVTEDRKNMHSTLSKMAESGQGISENLMKSLVEARYVTPANMALYKNHQVNVRNKKFAEKTEKEFKDLESNVREGKIQFFPGGKKVFIRQYGHLFKNNKQGMSAGKYWDSMSASIEKVRLKANNTGDPYKRNSILISGFTKGDLYFPKKGDFQKEPDAALASHQEYFSEFARAFSRYHDEGKIDLVNNTKDYEIFKERMDEQLHIRQQLIGRAFRGNDTESYTIDNLIDDSGVTGLIKIRDLRKRASVNGAGIGGNETSIPDAPIQQQAPESVVLDKPEEVKTEEQPKVNYIQLLENPRSKSITGPYFYQGNRGKSKEVTEFNRELNKFQPQYMIGYFTADHKAIEDAFANTFDVDQGQDKDTVYKNSKYKKAYYAARVSKRFQQYANNKRDNSERISLREDKTFHADLYELQKIDSNFDAGMALAEAMFMTFPTHRYDPNISASRNQTVELERKYMFYEMDSDGKLKEKPLKQKMETKRMSARDSIKSLDKTLNLLTQGKDEVAGMIPEGVTGVQTVINMVKNAFSRFTPQLKDVEEKKGLLGSDANAKVMKYFNRKAQEEQARLDDAKNRGVMDPEDYLIAQTLLSQKIMLAYSLSAQLQGDGTGGGRTISDADFQYALTAVWGPDQKVIANRLNSIRGSIQSKINRMETYLRYDKSGLATRVSEAVSGYDEYHEQRLQTERRRALLEIQENQTNPSIAGNPKNTDTSSVYTSKLEGLVKKQIVDDAPRNFVTVFGKEDSATVMPKIKIMSAIMRKYIQKDQAIIDAARDYNPNEDIYEFYEKRKDMNNGDNAFNDRLKVMSERLFVTFYKKENNSLSLLKKDEKGKTRLNIDSSGKKPIQGIFVRSQPISSIKKEHMKNLNVFLIINSILALKQ